MNRIIPLIAALAFSTSAAAYTGGIESFPKWQRVVSNEHVKPQARFDGAPIKVLLGIIATRYKNVQYIEDIDLYGLNDYWSTREEMVRNGGGDCEDFAIAAYFDLVEYGVDENLLSIVIVQDKKTKELHAYVRAGDLILDRRTGFEIMTAQQAGKRYEPIYSINRIGWTNLHRGVL